MSAAFAVWLVLQLVVFLGGVVLILGGAHGSGRMHEVGHWGIYRDCVAAVI